MGFVRGGAFELLDRGESRAGINCFKDKNVHFANIGLFVVTQKDASQGTLSAAGLLNIAYCSANSDAVKAKFFGSHRTTVTRTTKTVASVSLLLQNISLAALIPAPCDVSRVFCCSMLCFDETEETFTLKIDDRHEHTDQSSPYHLMACLTNLQCCRVPNDRCSLCLYLRTWPHNGGEGCRRRYVHKINFTREPADVFSDKEGRR